MRSIFVSMVFSFSLLFCFTGCGKEDSDKFTGSGPEISWIQGGTEMTFSYSSGVLRAYNLQRSFTVSRESGEVKINVQVEGQNDTKVSGTFNVEDGKQYKLNLVATLGARQSSSPGGNCLTVEFSSPNSRSSQDIRITSYLVPSYNEWMTDTYYCPNTLVFAEIMIFE